MTVWTLVGVLVGVAGGAVGAAVAFWWRSKFEAARGSAALVMLRLDVEQAEHKKTIEAALEAQRAFDDDERRDEDLISDLTERLQAAEARAVRSASDRELLDLANRLRPPAEAHGDGGRVQGPAGSGLGAVRRPPGP